MSYLDFNNQAECTFTATQGYLPFLFCFIGFLIFRFFNSRDTKTQLEINTKIKLTQDYLEKHLQEDQEFFFSTN